MGATIFSTWGCCVAGAESVSAPSLSSCASRSGPADACFACLHSPALNASSHGLTLPSGRVAAGREYAIMLWKARTPEALYSLMPLNPSIWPTLELKSHPVSEKGHLWLENCLSPRNLRVYQNIYRLVNSLRAGLCFISVCDLHISWKTPWNNRWSAPVCCNPEMSFTLNRKKLLEDTFRFKI